MTLPVPNLDDRRFQDIVDEAKRMIPSLCPVWTNHYVSDPGVALIELFAWMTEQVLYRLNQVPDRLYTQFLNLMGVAPYPAQPATADLTFWLSATPNEPVVVPAGTEVATIDADRALVFTTVEELRIDQPVLAGALVGRGEDSLRDVIAELRYDRDTVACFASDPVEPGDCFYLGFDRPLAGQTLALAVSTAVAGVGIDPTRPPILWEAWSGEYWVPCGVHADATGGLNRDGTVVLLVPRRHEPLTLEGQRRWWVRVRLVQPDQDQPTYQTSPLLRTVEVVCRGGTVRAEHSQQVLDEVIGRAPGQPGASFALAHRPILPRRPDEVVTVTVGDQTADWIEVADFSASGPTDRHVVWDEALGTLHFGPAVSHPDGTVRQHGAVPALGAVVAVRSYRHGGGAAGNVGERTITLLRSAIPFVSRVENLKAASGGVDAEQPDNVKARGPMALRTGQRAVTLSDYERLTLESTSQVARARCLAPHLAHDPVRVLVVPRLAKTADNLTIDDFALSDALYATVAQHLDERRVIGTEVEITSPYYVGVSVAALVRPSIGVPASLVRHRILEALYSFLSPIEGGPSKDGWPWDAPLTTAALVGLVAAIDGVAAVDDLFMFEVDLRNGVRLGDAVDSINVDERTLVLGSRHRVVVK